MHRLEFGFGLGSSIGFGFVWENSHIGMNRTNLFLIMPNVKFINTKF